MNDYKRIDKWLAARPNWASGSSERRSIVEQWREVSKRFGPHSQAAMGALLGLVRIAWGDPFIVTARGTHAMWTVVTGRSVPHTTMSGDSEADALMAALEAAPERGA